MDTLMYMMAILKDFHCPRETYLVVDNYQLVGCDIPRELMSVFSMHGSSNLHMIFIAQHLGTKPQITFHNAHILAVDPAAFFIRSKAAMLNRFLS